MDKDLLRSILAMEGLSLDSDSESEPMPSAEPDSILLASSSASEQQLQQASSSKTAATPRSNGTSAEENVPPPSSSSSSSTDSEPCLITDLPPELIGEILSYVTLQDALRLAFTCKELYCTVRDEERIWRPRCLSRFSAKTDPLQWVRKAQLHLAAIAAAEQEAAAAAAAAVVTSPPPPIRPKSARSRDGFGGAFGSFPMPSLLGGPPATTPLAQGGLSSAFGGGAAGSPVPRPPRPQAAPSLSRHGSAGGLTPQARIGSTAGPSTSACPPLPPPSLIPSTFLRLFKVLCDLEPLEGVWKCANDPKGSLYSVAFTPDCLEGYQWTGNDLHWRLARTPFCSIGPDAASHHGSSLSDTVIVLKDNKPSPAPLPPSQASQAATLTALLSSSAPGYLSESLLGSSPSGSFEAELHRFMQGSMRRRKQASPSVHHSRKGSQAWSSGLHLNRVVFPPGPQYGLAPPHPLEGVYKGIYGAHGLEVVQISLVPQGAAQLGPGFEDLAQGPLLVGTKILGDANVPAGERTFVLEALPMPREALTEAFLLQIEDIRFYQAQSDFNASSSSDEEGDEEGETAVEGGLEDTSLGRESSAGAASSPHPRSIPAIQHVHRGKGQVALNGHVSARFVPGFLLTFSADEFGFIFGGNYEFLVDFRRVRESDLCMRTVDPSLGPSREARAPLGLG